MAAKDDYISLGKAEDGFWIAVCDDEAHWVGIRDKDGDCLAQDHTGYLHVYIQDGEVRAK